MKSRLPAVSEEASPGEKLRYYRELHQLSQEKLAALMGITAWGIINLEKGLNPIYHETAVKLGEILQVDPTDFMDEYTLFCKPGYGLRIKKIRALYGLTQIQFAELVGNGFTRNKVSIWEAEVYHHHPNRDAYQRLKALAAAKGVDINDT